MPYWNRITKGSYQYVFPKEALKGATQNCKTSQPQRWRFLLAVIFPPRLKLKHDSIFRLLSPLFCCTYFQASLHFSNQGVVLLWIDCLLELQCSLISYQICHLLSRELLQGPTPQVCSCGLQCVQLLYFDLCLITYTSLFPTVFGAARSASALVSNFAKAVAELPHREAVRYTDKNIKWTASNVNVRIAITWTQNYHHI